MNFDDVEHLIEGVLVGLRARKEIEPLRKKNAELEGKITALIDEKNFLTQQIDSLTNDCDELKRDKENLRGQLDNQREEFNRQLAAAEDDFNRREENLRGQLDNQREEFNRQLAAAEDDFNRREENLRGELDNQREEFNRQLAAAEDDFNRQLVAANKKLAAAEKAREIAEGTAKFYRETYGELDAAYKIYSTLDAATRFDLAGIFGAGDTAAGFFSGAVQQEHLAPFWDYVSRHSDNEALNRLFDFCFEVVNRGFREPPYTRLDVAADNYFDSDFMRRTSQSRQQGRVARVILQGYTYSGGNVIKKSVVELA